jgi:hypothetical protein
MVWSFRKTFSSINSLPEATGLSRLAAGSTFQGLFEYMQLVITFRIFAAIGADLTYRVQDRCVIAATKQLTDFRQTFLRQLFGELHGNLARTRNICRALL